MRILHVGSTLELAGGIESFIMNVYRYIEDEPIIFDFLVKEGMEKGYYRQYVESRGGNIYAIRWERKGIGKYIEKYSIYKKYRKNVIHIHTNCGSRVIDGLIAKIAGCRSIIYHSHTCKGRMSLKFRVLQPLFRIFGDYFWACSSNAATFFFGRKILNSPGYQFVHNAVELKNFHFDSEKRSRYRKEWGIKEQYVLGYVGRFSPEKNIPFILEVLSELLKLRSAMLVLVGDGDEYEHICDLISARKLEKYVLMLGARNDVAEIMSAFDGFILPSLFEGLGIVLVEAQALGISCYASDAIPREAKVTELLQFLPLSEGAYKWAEIINNTKREAVGDPHIYLKEKGYDVSAEAKKIAGFYKEMSR